MDRIESIVSAPSPPARLPQAGEGRAGNALLLRGPESPNRTNWRRKAVRLGYVLWYHRPSQLALRLVSLARRRLMPLTGVRRHARVPGVDLRPRVDAGIRRMAERRLEASGSGTEALLAGRYRLLNVERALPDPIDWRLECWPDAPHLWRFHLHYQEYLLDLMAEGQRTGQPKWAQRAWDVVCQWIEANSLGDSRTQADAWHPFCISRRLPVWIALWSSSPPADGLRRRILSSMFCQARFLEDHLERDLGGNHLLENARALVLAGCFLEGEDAARWRRRGARIVQAELGEQILPHGEHFERSPGYHAEMLDAMLDVRDAAGAVMPELADVCSQTAEKMARFLREILHPDADLPLLGDCWLAGPEVLRQRITSAVSEEKLDKSSDYERGDRARSVGGYWVYRDGGDFLLLDAGPVGPDHLPAHAHADLLTLEASLGGRRLFVDSGVFGYEDDPLRRYCRSTAAHNVLAIDAAEQCDCWSRFRMGHRGRPLGFESGHSDGFDWALARHNAYRRLGVPVVGRFVACRPGGPWLCVDWAQGRGRHDLTLRLHLHPDVAVEQTADDEVRIEVGGVPCRLRHLAPGRIAITDGWYCDGFGRRRPTTVVLWTTRAELPGVCAWSLTWDACDGSASIEWQAGGHAVLRWRERGILRNLFTLPSSGRNSKRRAVP